MGIATEEKGKTMADCTKCLHLEVCGEDCKESIMCCDDFKDRSKWVEQKTGRWIQKQSYGRYECSVCGGSDTDCADYYGCHDVKEQAYCPNCGADMRERKDDG